MTRCSGICGKFASFTAATVSHSQNHAATCSHLQPLPDTHNHTQPLAATRSHSSGRKWPLRSSGRKWPQVAAFGKWPRVAASGRFFQFQIPHLMQPLCQFWPTMVVEADLKGSTRCLARVLVIISLINLCWWMPIYPKTSRKWRWI